MLAVAGRVYPVTPQATYNSLNPSGGIGRYNVCLQIPSGVTLDMRGSSLRLHGTEEAVLVANANLSGMGPRDASIGLLDAVLDGGNVPSAATSLLHLAHADHMDVRGVKIVRGNYQGGWIYDCRASVFDQLEVDGFVGQPWLIGSASGLGNQVYDSMFGTLRARNVTQLGNDPYFVGNGFLFVLTRCHVRRIEAYQCGAGIKVQWPGQDITIGSVFTSDCGDPSGNSGLKLQGDAQGGPVSRVTVGKVVARKQTGPGLYMDRTVDCTVASYQGVANNATGASADVWIGGTSDHVKELRSDESGGAGVVVRPYATAYVLDNVWVRNPNRRRSATGSAGVAIYGGSGALGYVSCVDTQHPSTMARGVDVSSPTAVGQIAVLEVTGESEEAFKSVSTAFPAPPPVGS